MTDHPDPTPGQRASDITDEELAELERLYPRPCVHVPRLIAALRTERAENERLRQDVANLFTVLGAVRLPPLL